jgi:hypothetical protein
VADAYLKVWAITLLEEAESCLDLLTPAMKVSVPANVPASLHSTAACGALAESFVLCLRESGTSQSFQDISLRASSSSADEHLARNLSVAHLKSFSRKCWHSAAGINATASTTNETCKFRPMAAGIRVRNRMHGAG